MHTVQTSRILKFRVWYFGLWQCNLLAGYQCFEEYTPSNFGVRRQSEDGGKCLYPLTRLCVTIQKTTVSTVTTMKTSNFTYRTMKYFHSSTFKLLYVHSRRKVYLKPTQKMKIKYRWVFMKEGKRGCIQKEIAIKPANWIFTVSSLNKTHVMNIKRKEKKY